MKNREKMIKIISLCLIVAIVIICLTLFISNIYKKNNSLNRKVQDKIELINSDYNQFSLLVTNFNSKREELIIYYEKNIYYEDFYLIKDELYTFYESYDEIIGKIKTVALSLDKNCGTNFNNESIDKKCNSYKEAYEMIINIFISDVNLYNEKVNKYNEIASDNFAVLYESKNATNYIDVDNDGIFSGKET